MLGRDHSAQAPQARGPRIQRRDRFVPGYGLSALTHPPQLGAHALGHQGLRQVQG
jgi:hypothetical protein